MTNELIQRLEVVLQCAKKYPKTYLVVAGGVAKQEWIEAKQMYD